MALQSAHKGIHISPADETAREQLDSKMHEMEVKHRERDIIAHAGASGVRYVNLAGVSINPDILGMIPRLEAWNHKAITYVKHGKTLRVAACSPESAETKAFLKELSMRYGIDIEIAIMSLHSFEQAFKLYEQIPDIKRAQGKVEITEEDLLRFQREIKSLKNLPEMVHKVSLTDVFTVILATAIKTSASDIHIEPEENRVAVRFRIDGVLQEVVSFEREIWKKLAPRIKLLAHLKINIENAPQDGRFSIVIQSENIDVRVAILPIAHGESVVLRLLYEKSIGIPFEELGISGRALSDLMREIQRPNGMILTTGPTGSGKTTTLYSMVHRLNTGRIKIVTLEDPIEYKIKGINQSQVNEKAGYTFAIGLKSLLRQDPDVVLVGEIRDLDTADTATNAALTGHLVISTLHTNDASGAIPRFLALGVKNFLLAPSLNSIIGQRLVRKLCQHCKKETALDPALLDRVTAILLSLPEYAGESVPKEPVYYLGRGCDECYGTGYKGRIGIFEILVLNEEVEQFIMEHRVSEYQMKDLGRKQGMVTMVQDGILKAIAGITSVEEVFRVAE